MQIPKAATGGVLKNFAKFTREHLCQSLFLTKYIEKIYFAENVSEKFIIRTNFLNLRGSCGMQSNSS